MLIRVTATVSFEYDTDDALGTTPEEAVQDVADILDTGEVDSDMFEIEWRVMPS